MNRFTRRLICKIFPHKCHNHFYKEFYFIDTEHTCCFISWRNDWPKTLVRVFRTYHHGSDISESKPKGCVLGRWNDEDVSDIKSFVIIFMKFKFQYTKYL